MPILVVGGSGMLGQHIISQLRETGETVRNFDLIAHPDPEVETIVGDLRQPADVLRACTGMEAVIHTASVVNWQLGKPRHIYDVNVTGTYNLIAACLHAGVSRLIYTSSIDVVFDGTPIRNGDESLPYPARHLDYYGETKMLAEQAVIAWNSPQLATCSLRVAGLYGPDDKYRLPSILRLVLEGRFTRIGKPNSRFSHVYIENAAHAHLLALKQLSPGSPVAGQCYFIADATLVNFYDFFPPYLDALNLTYRETRLSAGLAHRIAQALAWRYQIAPTANNAHVDLTPYVIASTTRDFWFNHDKATRDFAYTPIITPETAFERTLNWLREVWLPQNT